jgi:hypothetical protein
MASENSFPIKGLSLDSITSQTEDGIFTLMLNGSVESEDHKFTATNESSTVLLTTFKPGWYCIGYVRLNDLRTIVFLVNPDKGQSEIGYFDYIKDPLLDEKLTANDKINCSTCEDNTNDLNYIKSILETEQTNYNVLVYSDKQNIPGLQDGYSLVNTNDTVLDPDPSTIVPTNHVKCNCLAFDINHPIRKAVYKRNICEDRIYWTDGLNPPRYLIIEDIEGVAKVHNSQRIPVDENPTCPATIFLNELDCDRIRIFKNQIQPEVEIIEIDENGSIPVGTVQFSICYSDSIGNRLTHYYNASNPVIIIEDSYTRSPDTIQGSPINIISNKSVKLNLRGLDRRFSYYNLAIIENVNGAKNFYEIGPYPIDRSQFTYTGNEQQKRALSYEEFFQKRPVYQTAKLINELGDRLFIADVTTNSLPNFQRVANNIKVNWQAIAVPYTSTQNSYKDGAFSANYRGYMRGEVYPLGIVFEFADGTDSAVYHIPGRKQKANETDIISNLDVAATDPCDSNSKKYFELYDTSTIQETSEWLNISKNEDVVLEPFTELELNYTSQEQLEYYASDIIIQLTAQPVAGDFMYFRSPQACGKNDSYDNIVYIEFVSASQDNAWEFSNLSNRFKVTVRIGTTLASTYTNFYSCFTQCKYFGGTVTSVSGGGSIDSGYDTSIYNDNNTIISVTDLGNNTVALSPKTFYQVGTDIEFSDNKTTPLFELVSLEVTTPANYNIYFSSTSSFFEYFRNFRYNKYTSKQEFVPYDENDIDFEPVAPPTFTNNVIYEDIVEDYTYTMPCTVENSEGEDISVGRSSRAKILTSIINVTTTWLFSLSNVRKKNLLCDYIVSHTGEFSYWESIENYPCNEDVWGELAGKPIRHHKFPETSVMPHFSSAKDVLPNLTKNFYYIHPLGIKVDHESILNSLRDSLEQGIISAEEVSRIRGYKIVRGDRVADAGVLTKGLLYDVWAYHKKIGDTKNTLLYPNYPYNDLSPDPFILNTDAHYYRSNNSIQTRIAKDKNNWLKHPYKGEKNDRFTFHSPETSFYNPKISGYLNLELELSGTSFGHYVSITDHPKYQRLKNRAYTSSWGIAMAVSALDSMQIGSTVKFEAGKMLLQLPTLKDKLQDIMKTGIPLINFAYQYNSVGIYDIATPITKDKYLGNKIRAIEIATYMKPGVQDVGDEFVFNNHLRESSLYIKVNDFLPSVKNDDRSRYLWKGIGSEYEYGENLKNPEKVVKKPISSYYASVKRDLPDQYGLIHSIQYVYTGSRYNLESRYIISSKQYSNNLISRIIQGFNPYGDTIFGGDTFITRFAFKRQHSYFTQDRRTFNDNIDVNYSDYYNIGYPTFFFDTNIKLRTTDNNTINQALELDLTDNVNETFSNGDTDTAKEGSPSLKKGIGKTFASIRNMLKSLIGVPSEYFESQFDGPFDDTTYPGEKGCMYLHSFGIPYYFTESTINTELRHAGSDDFENFYPRVGGGLIPDDWLVRNHPRYDNVYNYNRTFSGQNRENVLFPLPLSYDPTNNCYESLPGRVVWSQESGFTELIDNWLLFRVDDKYDLTRRVTGIYPLPGKRILTTFENSARIFNSYSTIQTNAKELFLGSPSLFAQSQEISEADLGVGGSQNNAYVLTEDGGIYVDAKRGSIIKMSGSGIEDLTLSSKNWFRRNLPFEILKYFPNANIDNPYHHKNPLGYLVSYENRFNRVIITKHDFSPIYPADTRYDEANNKWYVFDNEESLKNPLYFFNKSFTLTYSLPAKNWISFHSYIPSVYVPFTHSFLTITGNKVYSHMQTNKSYQIVYGELKQFIIELPNFYKYRTDILASVMIQSEALKYLNVDDYKQAFPVFFNKAVIWNKYQSTGMLRLVYDNPNNDDLAIDYPKYNSDSISILYSSKDNYYTFNHLWNIAKPNNAIWLENPTDPIIKNLNLTRDNYLTDTDDLDRIRGYETFIRMIQDKEFRYKFKVYFERVKTSPSIY